MVVHAPGKVDGGRQSEPTGDNDDSDSSALSYLSSASDDSPLSSSRLLLRTWCTGGLGLEGEPQLLRTSLGGASCSLTPYKSLRSLVRVWVLGAT